MLQQGRMYPACSPSCSCNSFLPSQLLLLEQQMVNVLCWRHERSLRVLPPSPCSRTAWEMGTRVRSLPFIPCYHSMGFLGSDRLQGSVMCGQILLDVFPLPISQKAELRDMFLSPGGGKAGTSCPLSLQNMSGTSVRFPEMILDSFTQRGVVSGLLFHLLLCLSAWVPWSQELTWLLTRAALLLNEQKKNK